MKPKTCISCSCLLVGMTVSLLQAQMVGNPVGVRGTGEWTVSAIGTYMDQQVGSETAISRRILLKSTWGAASWLDLYCIGGMAQLELLTGVINIVDYKSKYRFGYGGGVNITLTPMRESRMEIYLGVQALRFPSEGSFQVVGKVYTQEFEMKYDWREFQGHVGIVYPYHTLRLYAAGVVWALQRFDTKNEYWNYRNSRNYVGESRGEYRSGVWTGGVVGLELLLPKGYAISCEGLFFNEVNYHIMVGISQTGKFDW